MGIFTFDALKQGAVNSENMKEIIQKLESKSNTIDNLDEKYGLERFKNKPFFDPIMTKEDRLVQKIKRILEFEDNLVDFTKEAEKKFEEEFKKNLEESLKKYKQNNLDLLASFLSFFNNENYKIMLKCLTNSLEDNDKISFINKLFSLNIGLFEDIYGLEFEVEEFEWHFKNTKYFKDIYLEAKNIMENIIEKNINLKEIYKKRLKAYHENRELFGDICYLIKTITRIRGNAETSYAKELQPILNKLGIDDELILAVKQRGISVN